MASTPSSASPACTRSSSIAGWRGSKIRHVTPRHEQGAGFMADGYARVRASRASPSLITGPGVTNAITRDGAGARRFRPDAGDLRRQPDRSTLGKGLGYLHELPDQRGMLEKVALFSKRVERCRRAAAGCARTRLRACSRLGAPGTGAYRNPARRDGLAGRRQAAGGRGLAMPPSRTADRARAGATAARAASAGL